MAKKQIQLNFFENTSCGNASCMGQWRLVTNPPETHAYIGLTPHDRNPLDKASAKDRAQYYVNLAKLAEKGKITSVFFTDGYGSHEVYESSAAANMMGGGHVGQLDPVVYVAPMALATESVGIVVTGSSSYLSRSQTFLHSQAAIFRNAGGGYYIFRKDPAVRFTELN
jgi:hypothetical protein